MITAELDLAKLEATQLIEQREVDALIQRAETLATQLDKYRGSTTTLERNQQILNDDLTLVLATLPPGVSLSSIQEGGDFRIQGRAYTKEQILEYTRNLEQTNKFSEIILSIQGTEASEDTTAISFQMRLVKGGN